MLQLRERGGWYHVEGKNSMGVNIPRKAIGIAVLNKETRKAAEKKMAEMELAPEWPPAPKEVAAEPVQPQGTTLLYAYDEWLKQYKEGSKTWICYRDVKRVVLDPLAAQGIVLMNDVTSKHLLDLQTEWKKSGSKVNSIRTWRKNSSCLFNYCCDFHNLAKNPWKRIKSIKELRPEVEAIMAGQQKDEGIGTLPLDLDGSKRNWLLIWESVPAFVRGELPGQRRRYASYPLLEHPDTFATLLWLMYETGLRRSDARIFRPDWIKDTRHGGSYSTTQVKTGDPVTVFLPQPLVDQLRALPLLKWARRAPSMPGAGLYPFYDGTGRRPEYYMDRNINEPLTELGQLIGLPNLHPHQFRDSFAVNMLKLNVPMHFVQRMLGHKSIVTTEKHYAPYVPGLKDAIEDFQAAARAQALFAEAQEAAKWGGTQLPYFATSREVNVN